jgi:hypothetical protein
MSKYFRLFIAILVFLGLVALAGRNVASAANPFTSSDQSALLSATGDDDVCDKHPNSKECKEKREKDKCKKKKNCGTVKPPPKKVLIPVTGQYSVGGFCTLTVQFTAEDLRLDASVRTPLPHPLPDNLYNGNQGCLLAYFRSNQRIEELLPDLGDVTICFASTPGKDMQIYFYDVYSAEPQWSSLETTTTNGMVCAVANKSGVYAPTFASP